MRINGAKIICDRCKKEKFLESYANYRDINWKEIRVLGSRLSEDKYNIICEECSKKFDDLYKDFISNKDDNEDAQPTTESYIKYVGGYESFKRAECRCKALGTGDYIFHLYEDKGTYNSIDENSMHVCTVRDDYEVRIMDIDNYKKYYIKSDHIHNPKFYPKINIVSDVWLDHRGYFTFKSDVLKYIDKYELSINFPFIIELITDFELFNTEMYVCDKMGSNIIITTVEEYLEKYYPKYGRRS